MYKPDGITEYPVTDSCHHSLFAERALLPGKLASLVVLDGDHPLVDLAADGRILDRWLFAVGDRAVRDVMVAGAWRIRQGRHPQDEEIDRAFRRALERLAQD